MPRKSKIKGLDETLTSETMVRVASIFEEENSDAFRLRMDLLIKEFGSAAEIARRCGFSEAVIRSWRDGASDPSRARCIALARGTGTSLLWIVDGEGPRSRAEFSQFMAQQSRFQPVRYDVLKVALQLAEELTEGKVLSTEDRAELVGLIYEMHEEGLPEAKILRFARAAVK